MKIISRVLKIVLWGVMGTFAGTSIYRCWDFYVHPDLYAVNSAPWYLSIQINAVLTVILVTILLVIMRLVKKKIR